VKDSLATESGTVSETLQRVNVNHCIHRTVRLAEEKSKEFEKHTEL
jgi:hypothetical protein